jgi:hypothetical protein
MKIAGSGSESGSGSIDQKHGSGSIDQRHGSADQDPHQNVMDPQHCYFPIVMRPMPIATWPRPEPWPSNTTDPPKSFRSDWIQIHNTDLMLRVRIPYCLKFSQSRSSLSRGPLAPPVYMFSWPHIHSKGPKLRAAL